MEKIGPGVYVDAGGAMQVDPAEICTALGFPPTPANMLMAELGAIDAVREANPDVEITEEDDAKAFLNIMLKREGAPR